MIYIKSFYKLKILFLILLSITFNLKSNKENLSNKKFKVGILFHLYDLTLMSELIDKINYFMKINSENDFYIKVNIPIDKNINVNLDSLNILTTSWEKNLNVLKQIKSCTPYHSNLINTTNYKPLYFIKRHLEKSLNISYSKLQVMFSENRGVDVGSFFLMVDQITKQNLDLDYLVKVHTKTKPRWRRKLTSILSLKVNNILNKYSYVCACSIPFKWRDNRDNRATIFKQLLHQYSLPQTDFSFCAGTMFIVSSKIIDFFKPYNFINIFNSMPVGYPKALPGASYDKLVTKVHAYERLFGYLAKHLNLKPKEINHKEYLKLTGQS